MLTFKDEMHQVIGYQITEIFNPYNFENLKNNLVNELIEFPYDRIKTERFHEIHLVDQQFQNISANNYRIIKERFLDGGKYKLLFSNGDFAKSFLTSEWVYKKYFSLSGMDNTFIVAGYLKSIEQLLWDIIHIIGQGRQIKGVTIDADNSDEIDKTLGSLECFITQNSNSDLFENVFGTNNKLLRDYLRKQLSTWRSNYRNGYFHKHNLEDGERIDKIREETIFLYLLILGSIEIDEDTMVMLG
jgi:hypothetical protein